MGFGEWVGVSIALPSRLASEIVPAAGEAAGMPPGPQAPSATESAASPAAATDAARQWGRDRASSMPSQRMRPSTPSSDKAH